MLFSYTTQPKHTRNDIMDYTGIKYFNLRFSEKKTCTGPETSCMNLSEINLGKHFVSGIAQERIFVNCCECKWPTPTCLISQQLHSTNYRIAFEQSPTPTLFLDAEKQEDLDLTVQNRKTRY